jgi:hypothetical protein
LNIIFRSINKKNIIAFSLISLGLSVLLVGEITYLARLSLFEGISFNQLLIGITFIFTFVIIEIFTVEAQGFKLLFFIIPISFSLFWSENFDYGLYKIGNLFLSSYIVLVFFVAAIKLTSIQFLCRTIVSLLMPLLIITVLFKIQNGFFDREVLFFLNGPIVFGRLMGIGAMLCLMDKRLKLKSLYFVIFTMAVIWTASKGPILALFIASLVYVLFSLSLRKQIVQLIIVIISALLVLENFDVLKDFGLSRVVNAITYLFLENENNLTSNSIDVRQAIAFESIELFLINPIFGVGLGDWFNTLHPSVTYPHNLFLEVFGEGGILLGFLFCIPYLIFLKNPNSILFYVVFFLLIAQQFSGDILDSRYWLIFSILSFCYCKNIGNIKSNKIHY